MEAFYSAYEKGRYNGLPLLMILIVYWPAIGNLVCALAYHWSFVLYDVIFCRQNKELLKYANNEKFSIPSCNCGGIDQLFPGRERTMAYEKKTQLSFLDPVFLI